ncbi:MAG TPA: FecR domain-containing protein [Steroidobacteraceae bacterium]|nr:FecR domain-containing protein [Steroidobacteraceae bacterium]
MSDADHRDSDRRENRKRELISQEAAEWFARMKDPSVPLDDRRRFLRWLKQSEVHVAEYLTVAGIDGDLRRARLTAALDGEAPSNVIELFAQGGARAAVSRNVSASRWKAAAAIAACGFAVLLFAVVRSAWHEHSIGTQPGEWKTVTLADGSELQVGPNTLLQLDLGDARRSIALVRGEAYFKVAKDPARPFFVQANAYAVRAVGTEFAVSRRKSELIVTVADGSVHVAPSAGSVRDDATEIPPELSVRIVADQQLRIAGTWPVTPSRVDVRYELAWRERQLMFRFGDTLADAVEEFNLRNRVQLRLDPSAAALPVRGNFDASDPVAFAQIMDGMSSIAVARLAPDLLLIKAR